MTFFSKKFLESDDGLSVSASGFSYRAITSLTLHLPRPFPFLRSLSLSSENKVSTFALSLCGARPSWSTRSQTIR